MLPVGTSSRKLVRPDKGARAARLIAVPVVTRRCRQPRLCTAVSGVTSRGRRLCTSQSSQAWQMDGER